MRGTFPAIWLSARGVWALLGLASLLAVASVVPIFVDVVALYAVVAIACVAADAVVGPSARTLRIVRRALPLVALRRTSILTYDVENRAGIAVRVGIFETPLPTIDFARDGVRATLPPRTLQSYTLEFAPRERGRVRFGALYAWSENRIGLLRRRYRIDAAEDVRVFPDLSAVEAYGTLARRNTLLDAGLRRLRLRGVGSDFESLRDYQTGDPFRNVDWKATARRGRMTVAQYEVERSQSVIVLLDCGRLMMPRLGPQRKFDYALTAALSVARVAQTASDNVGLLAFAAKPLLSIAPRRGAAHYAALAQATFDLQPRLDEPDYETIFTSVRQRYGKRSLIVLLTDIFDPVTSAAVLAGLNQLVPRHLVMCVLMNDAAIAGALASVPTTPSDAYRTAVAMTLADERARSVAILRARGIIVVDVPAPQLTVALMDAYLDVKARGRL
ncbi:MAG: DUF58 domain-containing protein [Candidatus Eremiobacteraeota bacterium]|nr:DUF58 domain-containing protein [Candidatus Eremiobacteraeota bacterium]